MYFCTTEKHSNQTLMFVWSGLYRVFLLFIFESYYHCCTKYNSVLIYSTDLVLTYSTDLVLTYSIKSLS